MLGSMPLTPEIRESRGSLLTPVVGTVEGHIPSVLTTFSQAQWHHL